MEKNLKEDCMTIFRAGIRAVDPYVAIKNNLRLEGDYLLVADQKYKLSDFKRVLVIGAGKASAPMALALEEILEDKLDGGLVM